MRATEGRAAERIDASVGGDVSGFSLARFAFGGSCHVIGSASGKTPNCAMNPALPASVSWAALHCGPFPPIDPTKIAQPMAPLFSLYERGRLPVQIGASFPLDRAVDALQEISLRRIQGKVVLTA